MTRRSPEQTLSGVGLGLRWDFLEEVLDGPELDVAFFEVSPENYMRRGGWYPAALERIRDRYAVVTHGLTLSLGAIEPPPKDYVQELRREIERVGSPWHSDHLCFSTSGPRVLHDLLPLQQSRENVRRVSDRLRQIQENGATILFVSHSAQSVISLCDRAILFDQGQKLMDGEPKEVTAQYQRLVHAPRTESAAIRESILNGDWRDKKPAPSEPKAKAAPSSWRPTSGISRMKRPKS